MTAYYDTQFSSPGTGAEMRLPGPAGISGWMTMSGCGPAKRVELGRYTDCGRPAKPVNTGAARPPGTALYCTVLNTSLVDINMNLLT